MTGFKIMILFKTGGQTMRKLLITFGVCAAVTVGSSSVAVAGWDEGIAAYQRGDYATALKEFEPLAEQGYAGAQYNLGLMYDKGHGFAQDYKQASQWYRKAAEQGFTNAQHNLGQLYHLGQGVVQEHKEAVRWFRKASEQGHASAQHDLGLMYKRGQGVNQDYKEPGRYFQVAEPGTGWGGTDITDPLAII